MAPFNISNVFLPALMTALFRSKLEPIQESTLLNRYDYIVIGSGFGGSVVANRLSENPNVRVLLLEAGGRDNISTQIPLMTVPLMRHGYDWMYESVPQKKACFGVENKACRLVSGKVIGGSSSLDMMIYSRGMREDFDEWEEQGNPGWSYDDLLPFFKKSENYSVDGDCIENELHGCGGEIFIGPVPEAEVHYEAQYFREAAKEIGYSELSYDEQKGVGMIKSLSNIRDGIRQNAATAFLRPVMTRPNLHISMDSFVHKIVIDPQTKVIIGVEFEKDGEMRHIKARKEIILSAGVYASPKILMLSGIGSKEILQKFNISVIADIPGVGQNLQEKIGTFLLLTKGSSIPKKGLLSVSNIKKWSGGTGPLASPSGLDLSLLLQSTYSKKDSVLPDSVVVVQSLPFESETAHYIKKAGGYNDKFWNTHVVPFIDKETIILYPSIAIPKSKGTVTIRSNDPHDLPLIDPNIYDEETDIKILIETIKKVAEIANTTALRKLNYHLEMTIEEECKQYKDPLSDEYLACYLKYGTTPKWCGCCTNKMGPDTDPMAVVDHRLRVHGVKGLRIADASVIPQMYSGLPNAGVIMVGEKAAHMMKEDNLQ